MATPKKESVKRRTAVAATTTAAKPTVTKPRARKSPDTGADEPRVVTHEQIAQRAHDLYVQSGHQDGREMDFWLEAERQLRETVLA